MKKSVPALVVVLLLLALAGGPSRAAPLDSIVYVDPRLGYDTGNTTCAQNGPQGKGPCATLNQALHNLPPTGGTVVIERGGLFGPIFLSGQVTIIGPADHSAIIDWNDSGLIGCIPNTVCTSFAFYAVDLQDDTPGGVTLKNLVIDNNGGQYGALHVGYAFAVTLDNVILRDSSTSARAPQLMLVDSSQGGLTEIYMHNCDIGFSASGGGIALNPVQSAVTMTINHSRVHNAVFGVQVAPEGNIGSPTNVQVYIDETQFFSFNNSAISISGPISATSGTVALNRSTISNTGGAALKVNGAGATASLNASVITGNGGGVNVLKGASVFSYQNNSITLNQTNCEVNGASTDCTSALIAQPPF